MHDQAFNLRALMMETASARRERGQRPNTWWLSSGKGGVGVSTMVVNLAAVLARKGRRVLVAAVNDQPQDLELLCGLSHTGTNFGPGLRQGPAGMLVLSAGETTAFEPRELRWRRLGDALLDFHGCVDLVLVDAGPRFGCAPAWAWEAGDTLWYVTGTDEMAVMDTYAAIKHLSAQTPRPMSRIGILFNQTADPRHSSSAFQRIAETTQRFLGLDLELVGDVPHERTMSCPRPTQLPVVLQSPTCSLARAVERVAAAAVRQTAPHY